VTTAFVLFGGGSLGAVRVGMLQALAERGIQPDFLVGASAGALNAAFLTGHGFSAATVEDLARRRGRKARVHFPSTSRNTKRSEATGRNRRDPHSRLRGRRRRAERRFRPLLFKTGRLL
jgi:predicted acylesterase/phospholipase RssA